MEKGNKSETKQKRKRIFGLKEKVISMRIKSDKEETKK